MGLPPRSDAIAVVLDRRLAGRALLAPSPLGGAVNARRRGCPNRGCRDERG